ncbi:MAG: putative metal-binding motif-containing protein [Proteobacteria bacterium]|nr:putative metal-binding motif-containing protein [Pseudomonadota bacterium]
MDQQCHQVGECDPATGACSNPILPNGQACNDGNACTQTDACQDGNCVGGDTVVCLAQDQCHAVGICAPATGICTNPPMADGTACSDDNSCTQQDTCQIGVCIGANPVQCLALDDCHLPGVCAPATGVCSQPVKADGQSCDDHSNCAGNDTCTAGVCGGQVLYEACCDQNTQCGDIGLVGGYDVPCAVNGDCTVGYYCSYGQCVPTGWYAGCTVDPLDSPAEFAAGETGYCTTCRDLDSSGFCVDSELNCTGGFDDDGDGLIDCDDPECGQDPACLTPPCEDGDGDSFIACVAPACPVAPAGQSCGECDDTNSLINPIAVEVCANGVDDNCDGQIDEGCGGPPPPPAQCVDTDADGYAVCVGGCTLAVGDACGDCNDVAGLIHPGVVEVCDSVDNDCDGLVDEGCPGGPPAQQNCYGLEYRLSGDSGAVNCVGYGEGGALPDPIIFNTPAPADESWHTAPDGVCAVECYNGAGVPTGLAWCRGEWSDDQVLPWLAPATDLVGPPPRLYCTWDNQ